MPGQNILGDCTTSLVSSFFNSIQVDISATATMNGMCPNFSSIQYTYAASYSASFGFNRFQGKEGKPCSQLDVIAEEGDGIFRVCGHCCFPFLALTTKPYNYGNAGTWSCDIQPSEPFPFYDGVISVGNFRPFVILHIGGGGTVDISVGIETAADDGEDEEEEEEEEEEEQSGGFCNAGGLVIVGNNPFLQGTPPSVVVPVSEILGTHVFEKSDYFIGAGCANQFPFENDPSENTSSLTTATVTISL